MLINQLNIKIQEYAQQEIQYKDQITHLTKLTEEGDVKSKTRILALTEELEQVYKEQQQTREEYQTVC